MKKPTTRFRSLLALLLLLCVAAAAAATTPAPASAPAAASLPVLPLLPQPAAIEREDGVFAVAADTPVRYGDARAQVAADEFARLVRITAGLSLPVASDSGYGDGAVRFLIDKAAPGAAPESYSLQADPRGVIVTAREPRGLFYGAVTLWQLVATDAAGATTIPAVRIDDAPRFAWRGLMLDSARHMQTVAEIKQVLDTMSLHKLNTFHWHLSDDQGWRIEIKRYPRLTGAASCRVPLTVPGTPAPPPYCGFYTQEQIREVVAYAASRQITVVPEIDMPGHAQAAVFAYPELGVVPATAVSSEWGVHKYLLNADESTLVFFENVLAEVLQLFPGTYVHVGGDEAVKDQWKASPAMQARMRELGVADEAALQSWFIHRLEAWLSQRGRRLIGWDEILEGGLPEEATVMSWRGIEGGLEAAGDGHDVVMAPWDYLYLDYLQTDSPNETPGRLATTTLAEVYGFEPVPAALAADKRQHIVGVQANTWTEHMRSFDRVQHALLPRLAALAETGWTPAAGKDWNGFLARLPAQLPRYRALGIGYAQTPFEVLATVVQKGDGGVEVSLSNHLGYPDIRYTTDGSEPRADSPPYFAPFTPRLPLDLRAAAFVDGIALAPAPLRVIDAAALRTRSDEEVAMCTGALMLRLEDDGPVDGERAIFNADIFNPCWLWKGAALDGIARIDVHAGRLPYNFQLAGDEPARKFHPATAEHGELRISDGCDGPLLATAPLPADADVDGFLTLSLPIAQTSGARDLCIVFTGDTRPAYWVLDRITLRP